MVLAPEEKIQEWTKKEQLKKGCGAQTLIDNALDTISKETREKNIDSANIDTFFSTIDVIYHQSVVVSWEEVIHSLVCEDDYKKALTDFYIQAKEEMEKVNPKR